MRQRGRAVTLALAAVLVASLLPVGTGAVDAATAFVVTSTVDAPDVSPADGTCAAAGGGACTIRAAVEQANALGGSVEITVPAGTYMVASNISVTGDITIRGAGSAATEFRPTAQVSGFLAIFLLAANASIAVHDAAYTDPTATTVAFLHLGGDVSSARLEDVAVFNARWTAAYVDEGVDGAIVEVVRTTITDVEYPIFFDGGLDNVLDMRESSIVRGGYSGLFVGTRTGTFTIADSEIVDSQGNGIEFSTGTAIGDGTSTLEIIRSRITGSTSDSQGVRVAPARLSGVTTHTTRIVDSVIADNTGIGAWVEGHLVIEGSTFSGNGAISGSAAVDQSGGSVSISGSTISGNGYGLDLSGPNGADPASAVTITNTTISDNVTAEWAGISIGDYAAVTITNTTVTGSSYGLYTSVPVTMSNTLIDGLVDCDGAPSITGGHNADTDGTCGLVDPGDQTGIDPLLGPLADNGGGTLTRLPLTGSPLIDAGDGATCPATDQRGVVRPVDGDGDATATCDVGAVEAGAGVGPGDVDLRWSAPTARRSLLAADGALTVTLLAATGGTAVARVDVVSWFTDADPQSPMLPEATAATVELVLLELSPGAYSGQLPLEGVERITGIEAELEIGGSTVLETTTERLPAAVAGALVIDVLLDVEPWALPTPRLLVRGASVADGDALAAPHDGTVTTRWLVPGDYTISVLDADNRTVADVPGSHAVRGGLTTAVDAHVAPQPYIPFTAKVVDANGHPVSGLRVTLVDDATGAQIAKQTTPADGTVPGVARSPSVGVIVDPLDLPYAAADLDLTLDELDQVLTVTLGATLPTAMVSGRILHPDRPPVAGARVSIASVVDGRRFTTSTVAGDGGHYEAVVFQGQVTVAVDEPRAGRASRTLEVLADTVVDLVLDGPALGTIGVELTTRLAGELVPTPVPLTAIEAIHYFVTATDTTTKRQYSIRGPISDVPIRLPQTFEVCADGWEGGLSKECVVVSADPGTLHAQASLALVQAGRIEGTLRPLAPGFGEFSEYRPIVEARLFRLVGDAKVALKVVRPRVAEEPVSLDPLNVPFSFGVPEPGKYQLTLSITHMIKPGSTCSGPGCLEPTLQWWGTDEVTLQVDIVDGAVILLGDVPMDRCSLAHCVHQFAAGPKTGTTLSPTEIRPGDIVRLRVSAHNKALVGETLPVDEARIRAELPDGTTVVPDSVTLDGEPVPFTVSDGILEVVVGTIAPEAVSAVQAWLTTDPGTTAEAMFVRGYIVHGPQDRVESLGSSAAAYRRLTMLADDFATTLEVPVSGRAFAGHIVEVLADGTVVTTTTAAAGGYWSATAVLPEVPLPKLFVLQARSVVDGEPIASAPIRVQYDPTLPTLRRVKFHQEPYGGGSVVINASGGVRQFPFVWVPVSPIIVELEFDRPERVLDPMVVLGENRAVATFDEDRDAWVAQLYKNTGDWGKLVVAWNYTSATIDLSPDVPPGPMTEAEVRALLAPRFNTFTNFTSVVTGPQAISTSVTLPDFDDATLTVDVSATEELYTPTQDDLDAAAASGADIWGFDMQVTPGPNDSGEIAFTYVVPVSSLSSAGATSATWRGSSDGPEVMLAASATAVKTLRLLYDVKLSGKLSSFTTTVDLYQASGGHELTDSTLERLLGLLERVDDRCSAFFAAQLVPKLEALARLYGQMTVGSQVLGLAAMGLTVGTLGLASFAVYAGTFLVNLEGGKWLGREIDRFERELKLACETTYPPEPPPALPDDCDRNVWFDACDVLADPTIIVDPSGFTYEVFPDDRLAGVTATLETAPTPDGPWSIWDAEWFLQLNPLVTDVAGRYAWDVPEGWWRVRFEKVGYATAYSPVLEVLPPHFDVNVGLERLAAPGVADAAGYVDETFVDVHFETWMAAAGLVPEGVTVVNGSGESEPFGLSLPDEGTSPNHGQVARTLRLDLGRPLVDGERLTVAIDRSAATYAGIVGDEELVAEVMVVARPTLAPPSIGTMPGSPSNATWIAIHGAATPGATVHVHLDGACATEPVAVLDAGVDGRYLIQVFVQPNATTELSARQEFGYLTSECSDPVGYRTDTVSPNAPTLTGTNPASPSSATYIVVAGEGTESGAAIALYVGGTCVGTPAATGIADGPGAFEIGLSVNPESTTEIRAIATDGAGNVSACSNPVTYVHTRSDTPTCVGTTGVELDVVLREGSTEVSPGATPSWVIEMTAVACEDLASAYVRGGTPAWSTTKASTDDGIIEVRVQRKNRTLTWLIGPMAEDQVVVMRLDVSGTINPKATCGSLVTIMSEWSATATADQPGALPIKYDSVGPLNAILACGATSPTGAA